tara:strand:+ start:154 stop:582 length:429 start_codon:yes stop_codon:yes gene_type:complete
MSQINYFFEEIKNCKHQLPPKKWLKLCAEKEERKIGCLNFIFCSDIYLRQINEKYLNKSYLTDVISFKNDYENSAKTIVISGDIFISIDRVKENKKTYKTIFAKELQRVMIHGLLHLIGYNDSTRKEKELMTRKENSYINLL